MVLSGYQAVWLIAMFDLPTDTVEAKRQYVRFRQTLLREGFTMLQYSVYARFCVKEEYGAAHRRQVRACLPSYGEVRIVTITDRQFGKMELYYGKNRKPIEKPPDQLLLF
jgi:CRISPR-associated protein Cas2